MRPRAKAFETGDGSKAGESNDSYDQRASGYCKNQVKTGCQLTEKNKLFWYILRNFFGMRSDNETASSEVLKCIVRSAVHWAQMINNSADRVD